MQFSWPVHWHWPVDVFSLVLPSVWSVWFEHWSLTLNLPGPALFKPTAEISWPYVIFRILILFLCCLSVCFFTAYTALWRTNVFIYVFTYDIYRMKVKNSETSELVQPQVEHSSSCWQKQDASTTDSSCQASCLMSTSSLWCMYTSVAL